MFIYTNPNPFNKNTGDCVIRAIAVITESTWEKAYIDLCAEGLAQGDLPNESSVWGNYLKKREDEEYSERMMYDSYGRDSRRYARGEGRYRRNQYGTSYGQYDDAYGYGYHEDLDRMMNEAKTEKERELIRQLKEAKRA